MPQDTRWRIAGCDDNSQNLTKVTQSAMRWLDFADGKGELCGSHISEVTEGTLQGVKDYRVAIHVKVN